ncbi:MAG: hypothetical protein OEX00_07665 [Gammaproteobacteria bacterium]|nr:hypothetical protein [Gammaproteobacteria bacterium]MDH5694485.1 hypothetical protein [Gammaproteobacteria bacterium]
MVVVIDMVTGEVIEDSSRTLARDPIKDDLAPIPSEHVPYVEPALQEVIPSTDKYYPPHGSFPMPGEVARGNVDDFLKSMED